MGWAPKNRKPTHRRGNKPSNLRIGVGSEIETEDGSLWVVTEDLTYVPTGSDKSKEAVRAARVWRGRVLWRSTQYFDKGFKPTGHVVERPPEPKRNKETEGSQELMGFGLTL